MSSTSISQVPRSRIDDIEVLRAIAVLFVVVHHAHYHLIMQPSVMMARFFRYFALDVGVDIFFVISGFVITRQLASSLLDCGAADQRFAAVLSFWTRRAWRLLPSAWVWLLLILLAVVFFNRSGAFGTFHVNLDATIAGIFQFANFRFANVFGRGEYGVSFAYWSLSLEEQFYMLFPILILVTRKNLPWLLLVVVIFQLFVERKFSILAVFRTDGIALGALIALWQRHPSYSAAEPRFLRTPYLGIFIIIMLLFEVAVIRAESFSFVRYQFSLVSVLAALLVFFASFDRDYLAPPRFLKNGVLWVGSRSYALYLIHVPAFYAAREIWYRLAQTGVVDRSEHVVGLVVTAAALLLLLSEVNYRCLEEPLRNYGGKVAKEMQRRILKPSTELSHAPND